MSQYASILDFKTLGLPNKALAHVDDATVNEFLIKASGVIDSFLRFNYSLPLEGVTGSETVRSTFPAELVDACVIIARYQLMVRRGYAPDDHDLNFRQTYEDVMAWLKLLANGGALLDGSVDATPTAFEGRPRVYTKTQRGWHDHNDAALLAGVTGSDE